MSSSCGLCPGSLGELPRGGLQSHLERVHLGRSDLVSWGCASCRFTGADLHSLADHCAYLGHKVRHFIQSTLSSCGLCPGSLGELPRGGLQSHLERVHLGRSDLVSWGCASCRFTGADLHSLADHCAYLGHKVRHVIQSTLSSCGLCPGSLGELPRGGLQSHLERVHLGRSDLVSWGCASCRFTGADLHSLADHCAYLGHKVRHFIQSTLSSCGLCPGSLGELPRGGLQSHLERVHLGRSDLVSWGCASCRFTGADLHSLADHCAYLGHKVRHFIQSTLSSCGLCPGSLGELPRGGLQSHLERVHLGRSDLVSWGCASCRFTGADLHSLADHCAYLGHKVRHFIQSTLSSCGLCPGSLGELPRGGLQSHLERVHLGRSDLVSWGCASCRFTGADLHSLADHCAYLGHKVRHFIQSTLSSCGLCPGSLGELPRGGLQSHLERVHLGRSDLVSWGCASCRFTGADLHSLADHCAYLGHKVRHFIQSTLSSCGLCPGSLGELPRGGLQSHLERVHLGRSDLVSWGCASCRFTGADLHSLADHCAYLGHKVRHFIQSTLSSCGLCPGSLGELPRGGLQSHLERVHLGRSDLVSWGCASCRFTGADLHSLADHCAYLGHKVRHFIQSTLSSCGLCPGSLGELPRGGLQSHLERVHLGRSDLVSWGCASCRFTGADLHSLADHCAYLGHKVRHFIQSTLSSCGLCPGSLGELPRGGLQSHLERVHLGRSDLVSWGCASCRFTGADLHSLADHCAYLGHKVRHFIQSTLSSCGLCPGSLGELPRGGLQSHLERVHLGRSDLVSWGCASCRFTGADLHSLADHCAYLGHKVRHFIQSTLSSCGLCPGSLGELPRGGLQSHLERVHLGRSDLVSWGCASCRFTGADLHSLADHCAYLGHKVRHFIQSTLSSCGLCPGSLGELPRGGLQSHLERVHLGRSDLVSWGCASCRFTGADLHSLADHCAYLGHKTLDMLLESAYESNEAKSELPTYRTEDRKPSRADLLLPLKLFQPASEKELALEPDIEVRPDSASSNEDWAGLDYSADDSMNKTMDETDEGKKSLRLETSPSFYDDVLAFRLYGRLPQGDAPSSSHFVGKARKFEVAEAIRREHLGQTKRGRAKHNGTAKTTAQVSAKYHWPYRHRDVARFIANCPQCSQRKDNLRKLKSKSALPNHSDTTAKPSE